MSDKLRELRGPELDVRCNVESATVIEVGDFVYFYDSVNVRYIKPASSFAWDSNILTTQKAYKLVHMGIAKQHSSAGETKQVLVDASPHVTFREVCESAKFTQGDYIAPAKATGNTLENQKVVETDNALAAIARVSENFQAANVTTVHITGQVSALFNDLSDAASGD